MKSDTLRLMARELTEMVKNDAQARLDPARVGAGEPAAQCPPAAGQVRLSARPRRGSDPTRAAASGVVNGEPGLRKQCGDS